MAQDIEHTQDIKARIEARRQVATERAERIRSHLADAAQEYAAAIIEEDWKALEFGSLEAWRKAMFAGHRLTPQTRRQVAEVLHEHGMGTKEIAGATGSGQRMVQRDLAPRQNVATPADQGRPSRNVTKVRPGEVSPKTPAERQADHRQREREARTTPVTKTSIRRKPVTGDEWDEFNRELSELAVERQDQELAQEVTRLTAAVARKDEFITQLLAENRALKAENEQLRTELKARVLAAYLSAHRTMINGSALCAALAVTDRDYL